MILSNYKSAFTSYFDDKFVSKQIKESLELMKMAKRIFFIGNGGSNSICSHMMEDYAKICRYPTFSFSDPALITCFSNDYGYDKAIVEWLKIHFTKGDLLIAISSSGKSANILNAVDFVRKNKGNVITLSGFKLNNPLSTKGKVNFHIPVENFGIVECYHQVILHIVLDTLATFKNK